MIHRINNVLEPNCAQIYKRPIVIIFIFYCFVNRSAISCYKEVLRWELSVDTCSWNKSFFMPLYVSGNFDLHTVEPVSCFTNCCKISDKIACVECFITITLIKPKNKCMQLTLWLHGSHTLSHYPKPPLMILKYFIFLIIKLRVICFAV